MSRSKQETREDDGDDDASDTARDFLRAVAHAPSRRPPIEFKGNDRYRVEGVVGQGGFGTVYDCVDTAHGSRVAVKVLRHVGADQLVRFKQEFRTLADISHANLVRLDRLEQEGDRCLFAMELVDGVDLLTWVRADKTRLRPALLQLMRGIVFLHARGIVHRDLKPSNILVDVTERVGRVVIVDFGVSQLLHDDARALTVEGTPSYMAPEQLEGQVTPASDWYAFGVVLLEALTGKPAFDVETAKLKATKQEFPPPDARALPDDEPLRVLCLRLLDPDPQTRANAADVAAALGADDDAFDDVDVDADEDVVGRDHEIARLQVLWTARAPAVALVSGPSGVGKSALLAAARARFLASSKTGWWLDGRCIEEEAVPWKALDRVVDALVAALLALPRDERRTLVADDVADAARLFPALTRLPDQRRRPTPAKDVAEARRAGAAALRRLLERVAAQRALVVVIDDLHWGDVDSVPLLDALWDAVPAEGGAPALLLIGAVREGEASDCVSALLPLLRRRAGRDLQLDEIALRDLPPAAAAEAAAAALASSASSGSSSSSSSSSSSLSSSSSSSSSTPASAAHVAEIVRESGGRPFLIQQLARFSGEEGFRHHLRSLPDDARRLLSVIAVAGHPLTRRVARGAMGDHGTSDVHAFGLLRARRLARVTRSSTTVACDIYHSRIRDVVVADLDVEARVHIHRGLADAMELDHGDPGLIARHWSAAGEKRRARFHATRAGEAALKALAFDAAAQHFQFAADNAADDDDARAALTLARAEALALGGRGAEAGPLFLAQSARANGDDALHLRRRGVDALLLSGHVDEGVKHLKALMADVQVRFPKSQPAAMGTMLLTLLVLWWKGAFKTPTTNATSTSANSTTAVAKKTPTDPRDVLRADIVATAFRGLLPVEPAHAAHFAVAELYFARKIADPRRVAVALARVGSGVLGPAPGRLAKIGGHLIDVAGTSIERDGVADDRTTGILCIDRGAHAFWQARWRTVVDEIDRGLSLLHRSGNAGHEGNIAHVVAIRALEELGEWREARSRSERMWVDARARGDHYGQTSARLAIAMELLVEGNVKEARAHATEIAAAWHRENFSVQEVYAMRISMLADAIEGKHQEALAKLTSSWAGLKAGMHLAIQASVIDLHSLRGLLAVGVGNRELARESAKALRAAGRVDGVAHACAIEAAANDDVGALDAAAAGYDAAGMRARALAVRLVKTRRLKGSKEEEAVFADALVGLGVGDVEAFVVAHVPG